MVQSWDFQTVSLIQEMGNGKWEMVDNSNRCMYNTCVYNSPKFLSNSDRQLCDSNYKIINVFYEK